MLKKGTTDFSFVVAVFASILCHDSDLVTWRVTAVEADLCDISCELAHCKIHSQY